MEYGPYEDKIGYYPQWSDGIVGVEKVPENAPSIPDGFKLMFAGAVGEAHGFECTMQAALRTKDQKDIKWVIVGDGRRLDWVRDFVKEHGLEETVFTLGRYPAETMPWFFKQADVMLVTLSDDPLFRLYAPAKISSYMAAEKPIVAVLNGEGAGIAPWNIHRFQYNDDALFFEGKEYPFVFYHMHGVKLDVVDGVLNASGFHYKLGKEVIRLFYEPYVKVLVYALNNYLNQEVNGWFLTICLF